MRSSRVMACIVSVAGASEKADNFLIDEQKRETSADARRGNASAGQLVCLRWCRGVHQSHLTRRHLNAAAKRVFLDALCGCYAVRLCSASNLVSAVRSCIYSPVAASPSNERRVRVGGHTHASRSCRPISLARPLLTWRSHLW